MAVHERSCVTSGSYRTCKFIFGSQLYLKRSSFKASWEHSPFYEWWVPKVNSSLIFHIYFWWNWWWQIFMVAKPNICPFWSITANVVAPPLQDSTKGTLTKPSALPHEFTWNWLVFWSISNFILHVRSLYIFIIIHNIFIPSSSMKLHLKGSDLQVTSFRSVEMKIFSWSELFDVKRNKQ